MNSKNTGRESSDLTISLKDDPEPHCKSVDSVMTLHQQNHQSLIVANHARKFAESISSASVYSDLAFAGSQKQFQEIGGLKEQKILCKGLLFILLPGCIIGCLAMFFPSFYVLYPLQESGYCVCSFYEMQLNNSEVFVITLNYSAFEILTMANTLSFYIMNWIGLLILIILVYRIRHTSDDTFLKIECIFTVGVWVSFTIAEIILYAYNFIQDCYAVTGALPQEEMRDIYRVTYKLFYWMLIARDLLCLLVMVFFQYKAATSQQYFNRLLDQDDKDTAQIALQDFDMLLLSVLPYKAFSRFLHQQHPEMVPYLQMIHLCKLYQDDQEMLQEIRELQ